MPELQQIAVSACMARDAATLPMHEQEEADSALESEYYRGPGAIRRERDDVDAHRALTVFVPLLAAMASMVMTAVLSYKGLHNVKLALTDLRSFLINWALMKPIGAAWSITVAAAGSSSLSFRFLRGPLGRPANGNVTAPLGGATCDVRRGACAED